MLRRTVSSMAGVSAMAAFAPPAKVELKQWCEWTGNSWNKVSSVVGSSFRVPCANENAYTMAATAVLRLIINNNIDPTRVGFLGLGTESSTDNSAGAVIVRGMVDDGLAKLGHPRLSRHCEVPEFKHACLGGVYALKSATRFVATDGADRVGIVVASDIAEYAQGSTGEQTQGAGAVAMMVENTPKLFDIDLAHTGSGSAYRGPDFRKPVKRHFIEGYHQTPVSAKIPDFPVFSGPYSTVAYLEEVTTAVEMMLTKLDVRPSDYYSQLQALFFHRPYNMMPIQAMSFLFARALARSTSAENVARFEALCAKAKVTVDDARADLDATSAIDLFSYIDKGQEPPTNVFAPTQAIAKALRSEKEFGQLLETKMSLGSKTMANFGNLYTAALPCWIAAGFEEAYQSKLDITGKPMVIVGYGSGDAAESIPITPVPGWEAAAANIGVGKALDDAVELTKEQYDGLHSGKLTDDVAPSRSGQFVIDRIGTRNEAAFQDIGIEYYSFTL